MKSLIPRPVRKTSQSPSPASSQPRSAAQPSPVQRALSPRPASVSSSTNTTHSRTFKPMSPPTAAPAIVASDQSLEAMMPALDRVKSPTPQPAARRSRGSWLIGGPGGKGVSVASKSSGDKDRKSRSGGGHARGTSISSVDFGADARDSLCCGDTIADGIAIADSSPRARSSLSRDPATPDTSSNKSKSTRSTASASVPQPPLTPPPSASATGKSFTVIAGSRTRTTPPRPPVQAERSYFSDPVTPPETASSLLHAIAAGSTPSSSSPSGKRHPFAVPTSPGPPVWDTPVDGSLPATPSAAAKAQTPELPRPPRSVKRASSISLRPRQSPSRDDVPTIFSPAPDSPSATLEKDPRSLLPTDADVRYLPSPSIADIMSEMVSISQGPRVATPELSRSPGPSRRHSEHVEVGELTQVPTEVKEDFVKASSPPVIRDFVHQRSVSPRAALSAGQAGSRTPQETPLQADAVPVNHLLPEVLRPRLAIELSWQNNLLPSVGFKSVPASPAPSMKRSSTMPSLASLTGGTPGVNPPKAHIDGHGKPPSERVTLPRDSRRPSLRYASQTAADVAAYGVGFIPLRGPRTRLSSLIGQYGSAPSPENRA